MCKFIFYLLYIATLLIDIINVQLARSPTTPEIDVVVESTAETTTEAPTAPTEVVQPITEWQREYIALINAKRREYGLNDLEWRYDESLYPRLYYAEMEMNDYIQTWYDTGISVPGKLHAHKDMIAPLGWINENAQVQYSPKTPQEVFDAFWSSQPHRETMLGNYRYICALSYSFDDCKGNSDTAYYDFFR